MGRFLPTIVTFDELHPRMFSLNWNFRRAIYKFVHPAGWFENF